MPRAQITHWSFVLTEGQGEIRDKALKGQEGCQTSWTLHYSHWTKIQNFLSIVQMDLISTGEPPSISIPGPSGFVVGRNEGHELCPSKTFLGFFIKASCTLHPPCCCCRDSCADGNWCVLSLPTQQFLHFSSGIASCIWKIKQTRTKCYKNFLASFIRPQCFSSDALSLFF